jgi:hypothetical protein
MAAPPVSRFPVHGFAFPYPTDRDRGPQHTQTPREGTLRPRGLRKLFRKQSSGVAELGAELHIPPRPSSSLAGPSRAVYGAAADVMRRSQECLLSLTASTATATAPSNGRGIG